jgi:thymidylate synthase
MMIAHVCGLLYGEFIHSFGDVHIYNNHVEQVKLQLSREPRELPIMFLNEAVKNIDDFKYSDFKLLDYFPHPAIKADVAV